jgi:hypothetical protein
MQHPRSEQRAVAPGMSSTGPVRHASSFYHVLLLALSTVLACTGQALANEDSRAQRVSTMCQLQQALADPSVVHVVVREHLKFEATATCVTDAAATDGGRDAQRSSSAGSGSRDRVLIREPVDCRPRRDDDRRERSSTSGDVAEDVDRESGCEEETSGREERDDRTDRVEMGTVTLPLLVRGARKTIRV